MSHWHFYSTLRASLSAHVPALLRDLAQAALGASSTLDLTCAGLDAVSRSMDRIGVERAQECVGEVMRLRTYGARIMPVNVAWSQPGGLDAADLRREAASEVRRALARLARPGPPR